MDMNELKTRRAAAGLSQRELGEMLGVSADTVKSWELGRNPLSKMAGIAINAVLVEVEAEQSRQARQADRAKHISELAGGKRPGE